MRTDAQYSWIQVYLNVARRAEETDDPALKNHYEQELKVIKLTLDAMDIKIEPGDNVSFEIDLDDYDSGNVPPVNFVGSTPEDHQHGNSEEPKPGDSNGLPSGGGNFSNVKPNGQMSHEETMRLAKQLAEQLMKDFNLTKSQAAGIVGNLMHESGGRLDPSMNQIFGFEGSGGPGDPTSNLNQGYGWVQWSYDRKKAYLDWAKENGLDPGSPAANYGYLKKELLGPEGGFLNELRGANTPQEAAEIFSRRFLRPEVPNYESRMKYTQEVYDLL
ncbi:MAG: hypothetical protein JWM42_3459 [Burkholderia sp.]|nr:hypothetical protein [Burkholderia sp.]